jgi:gliding motility-associated-like protein
MTKLIYIFALFAALCFAATKTNAQCTSADIMEPGFNFITSSRGCAPFEVQIQTQYLNSSPGTIYHVDWGDGSPVQDFVHQVGSVEGPIITHEYVNVPVACGYQVILAVENACNPLGSVVLEPINVVVWTEDLINSDPDVFRVCQGTAASIAFSDGSNWNCFPRPDLRENSDPRWIQWIYGDAANTNQIPGIQIAGVTPGSYPYFDPAPNMNPKYPVNGIDQISLEVQVPATAIADIGKDFYVTLNNWNTCNAYDEFLGDGPLNPINAGGDNPPRTAQSRIVIVATPEPDFVTRKENASNPILTDFCIGDIIYFDNETTVPAGANPAYTWEFYDGPNVADGLLGTRTNTNPVFSFASGGQKLIRLRVVDNNAVGGCNAVFEKIVNITPTSIAQISASDTRFCKVPGSADVFTVTFNDVSIGTTVNTEWKWELYNEQNTLVREVPAAGYSSAAPTPIVHNYSNPGIYRVVLISRDIITLCDTRDEINIVVYNNPEPSFTALPGCEGFGTELIEATTLNKINGNQVISWEWDFNYDQVTFNPDTVFNATRPDTLLKIFSYGSHQVALRATADQYGCSAIFTDVVEVYQSPVATFTKDIAEGCSPLVVNLENTSMAQQPVGIDSYAWCIDYGNGYIDTLISNPNQIGFDPVTTATFENWSLQFKTIKIMLKAISTQGCVFMSEPDSAKVLPSIKPGFVYTNYEPLAKNCSPINVNFRVDNATMALAPNEFTWTVSDANGIIRQETTNGSVTQFAHEFSASGRNIRSYTINLQTDITDICAGDSSLTVNVNPMPVSEFTIDTLEFNCDFMTIGVEASQKGLVNYNWRITRGGMIFMIDTLDDYFTYTIQRPAPESETMVVSIELVTENYAFCASPQTTHGFNVPPQPNLRARFTANPEIQVYPNATVTINNLSSRSGALHAWDFGNGHTSGDVNPAPLVYENPGNYTITLQLDEDFCTSHDTVHVYIQPVAPVADFSADPPNGCVPLKVNFTNLTLYGDPNAYVWYFGEGEGTSRSENPTYIYYQPGSYTVRLEATNSSGVTDVVVKRFIIEAYPVPHADFTVRPANVKLPDDPIYTTNLSFEADTYFWQFGDGSTSTAFEPSHVYTDSGRYDITLIATTDKGCADTVVYENIVKVEDGNQIRIPNAFTPNLDGPTGGNRYNDGRNDVFFPVTEGVIAYHMQIYNRWGELLFDTTDTGKGWDGYYNGKICPPDVYIYKIDFKFIDGREVMKFGDVALIR